MMTVRISSLVAALVLLIFGTTIVEASTPQPVNPSAMATLTCRSAKPGDRVELVVTVRSATHPSVLLPPTISGLRIQVLRKPRQLHVDGEGVWLFRFRVTPTRIGEYEIPPLQVTDGLKSVETGPLFLHVSREGELPPLSSQELAFGVNIPASLSQEVLKNVPQPAPKPEPSPTPRDARPWSEKAAAACWNGLREFWNYPGK